jgi:translation initiation factor 1A
MEKQDFGDFEEIKEESDKHKQIVSTEQKFPSRVRFPKGKELIGIIVTRLGGNRMDIKTTDGKTRNCRVPGRYRRRLWLRPKNYVIIVPWEFDDAKGDIIYKYNNSEVNQLKKKKMLDSLNIEF